MVSVICPVFNEERYIHKCIESVLAQDYPRDDMEVLFVDGMSTDSTRQIVSQYAEQYPFIHLLDNPYKIVPYAMNLGIQHAQGDIIVRIDAHAEFPSNYVSMLVRYLLTIPDAENVGAPCITRTLGNTSKARAIVAVLSSRFGVGNSDFRTGIDTIKQVDTVPFGCWKKNTFDKYGYFDTRLVRNQDIEMNKRILAGGGQIYIVPDTYSVYYARDTYKALGRNNYGNGKWNILTVYYTNQLKSLSIRHFVPLCFVLSLIVPVVLSCIYPWCLLVTALSLTAYLCALSIVSSKIARAQTIHFGYLIWAFVTLHISYGWGSLVGLLSLPFTKKTPMTALDKQRNR